MILKGQCHEIFDPRFFFVNRLSLGPRLTLKYFRIMYRICRDIRP
jgi:hypothetical protein